MIFNEEFLTDLNENLPYKLLKAYHNTVNKKAKSSTFRNNPTSDHGELRSASWDRRYVKYDYGKAEYKKLTADEAIDLLRGNFLNQIQNIRIVIKVDDAYNLAEWEGRTNTSAYAVYTAAIPARIREKETMSFLDTLPDSWTTKYIKSAAHIFALMQSLDDEDAIYWTDEYNHLLSDDAVVARRGKNRVGSIDVNLPNDDPNYTAHAAGSNIRKHYIPDVLDTGSHTKPRWLGYDKDTDMPVGISPDWDVYFSTLEEKKKIFKKYSFARQVYKALLRNKDLYDDEEFNELSEKYKNNVDIGYKIYLDTVREYQKAKQKLIFNIDQQIVELKHKPISYIDPKTGENKEVSRKEYLELIQSYLNKIFNAKEKYDDIQKSLVNLDDSDLGQKIKQCESDLEQENTRIQTLFSSLLSNLRELGINPDSSNLGDNIEKMIDRSRSQEIQTHLSEIMDALSDIENSAMQLKFKKIDAVIEEVEKAYDELEVIAPTRVKQRKERNQAEQERRASKLQDPKAQEILSIFNFNQSNSDETIAEQ